MDDDLMTKFFSDDLEATQFIEFAKTLIKQNLLPIDKIAEELKVCENAQ